MGYRPSSSPSVRASFSPPRRRAGEEKVHELKASPTTVHRGFFDASLKPVLTIDFGDVVKLWTTTGNPRYFESLGVPEGNIQAELFAAFEGAPGEARDDHTLDGPIEGAARVGARSKSKSARSNCGCRLPR